VVPVSRGGRAIARTLGAGWRGLWWVTFPPLGWYMSRQARQRRRHNELVRATASAQVVHVAPTVPLTQWYAQTGRPAPPPEYGRPPVPPPPPWWGTPAPTRRA
jgi:hypothetical protein